MKASGSARRETQVTIVGQDKESVTWAFGETFRAGK
jgi:hypothetical protein